MYIEIMRSLKGEILLFFLAMTIAAAATVVSYDNYNGYESEKNMAHYELNKINRKYIDAIENKKRLEEFRGRYIKLKNLGIAGYEDRMNWIGVMDDIAKKHGITYLKYRISTQQKSLDRSLVKEFSGVDIYQSVMELDMHLMHEGELFRIFGELEKKAKGIFDISSCEIKRNKIDNVSFVESSTDRNLVSTCILNWYSMRT